MNLKPQPLKLNIGSFSVMNAYDWINIDIQNLSNYAQNNNYKFQQLDITKGLPYQDNSISLINLSHTIEHLSRINGNKFLKDTFRILIPGGIIRITIPDPQIITEDYLKGNISRHQSHNEGVKNSPDDAESLYHLLIAGHQTIYDEKALTKILKEIGFTDIQKMEYQKSKSSIMEKENKDVFPMISLYLEAVKPNITPIITYGQSPEIEIDNRNTKIAVCTFYTPDLRDDEGIIEDWAKYSTLNQRNYCKKHGYDYIEEILDKDKIDIFIDSSHPYINWYKLILLSKTACSIVPYDWLLWIDADAIITNPDIKIESMIKEYVTSDTEFIVTHESAGCRVISTGVMLIRNSDWSKNFLKNWYIKGELPNAQWRDQDTFHWFLQTDKDVKEKIKIISQNVMNSFPQNYVKGDFILHFAGTPRKLKQLAFKDDVYISKRDQFPELLNKLQLDKLGVEIGVQKGLFSETILKNSNLNKLYLIDPWKHLPDQEYHDISNVSDEEQEKNLKETKNKLEKFNERIEILRFTSSEAVNLFQNNQLDFVYIDANHSYEKILEDIKNWYPKVKEGGILAGHDYLDGNVQEGNFGVKSAVLEFFKDRQDKIYLTAENWPSWYVIKNNIYSIENKTKKLKIAIISTPFFTIPPKGYSGLEMIVWDLACALDELGNDVTIFGPEGSMSTPNGYLVVTGPSINSVGVNWFEEERKRYEVYKDIITPDKYDIIHDHTWFAFIYLLKGKYPQLKVIHTHHGSFVWESPPPFAKPNLVAISNWMKTYTEEYFKQRGYNIHSEYVLNGIDLDKYPFDTNIKKSDNLLFVGRYSSFKHPDLAIEVAKRTIHEIDLIGGSFIDSIDYLKQIESMCDSVNTGEGKIRMWKDTAHEFKIEKMQKAKAILIPSQMNEPFNLVSIEGQSCGTCAVVLKDGGLPETIIHGKTGFVCNSIDEMIYCVKNRIKDINPTDCRKHIEDNFSRLKMAKSYEKLYQKLIHNEDW